MKYKSALPLLAGVLFCAPLLTQAQSKILAESRFDNSIEGWEVFGDAQNDRPNPDFVAAGGNPAGHIRAVDDVFGDTWYFNAPESFLGNQSEAYGGVLYFELRQSDLSEQFEDDDVLLIGGANIRLGYRFQRPPGLNWSSYTVTIDEAAGWKVVNTQTGLRRNATQAEIKLVLASLSRLAIRGEYRNGDDTGGLDNVILAASAQTGVREWTLY